MQIIQVQTLVGVDPLYVCARQVQTLASVEPNCVCDKQEI